MPRLARLRTKLLLLAAASVMPVLVLAWALGWMLLDHEHDTFRRTAQERNRLFLNALDAQMEGHLSALRALGSSQALQRGDLLAFDAQARRVLPTQVGWRNIMLIDSEGRQLLNMRIPFGSAQVQALASEMPILRRLMASVVGAWSIGDLTRGPASGVLGIPVRLRVDVGGRPHVLQFILEPESFTPLMQSLGYSSTWAYGLTDRNGVFIARVPVVPPGGRMSADFGRNIQQAPEGWFRGRTLEGRDTYTAYRTSAMTGWASGVAVPADEVSVAARRAAVLLGIGALASLLLALAIAWWLGRRIAGPIAQLAEAARHLGQRRIGPELQRARQDSTVAEVHGVAAALEESDAALAEREALRQREQDALLAADRAKDEFLAMLGHELRNPLSAITASAHVLRLSKPEASATVKAHEVIDRQARQMTRLVEDLMDVSRLAMGKVSLHVERLDLAQLTERVVQAWHQGGRSRADRVRLELSPAWIDADRARMEQVLSNLLDNAHKFSRDGSIDVRVRALDGQAVLEVQDQGEGIDADDLPRIFGLFVQGEQSFDRPQGGIGLGLALVRKLVELQGGSVEAASEGRGRGACLTVRLPLAVEGEQVAGVGGHQSASAARRVLLVEDNEDGRQVMEMVLTLEGHTVRAVGLGLEAIDVVREWQPDVALVDIGLPDIDGYEVARRIRALDLPARPRLVAITGFGQPEDQRTAYEAGFDLHLTKPVAPEFLRDVMQAMTGRQATAAG